MIDPARLAPLGTAGIITLLVVGVTYICLKQGQPRNRRLLSCYASIVIPALVLVFGLGHIADDMVGQHLGWCPSFILLLGIGGMAVFAVLGFVLQQWRIAQQADLLALPAQAAVQETVARLASRLGLALPLVMILPTQRALAFVVGIRQPRIYLAEWFLEQLTPVELEQVLAHELAHIQRQDNLIALINTFFWGATAFLPSSWWAFRHILRERELAADEIVIRLTGKPAALARALVKVVAPENYAPLPGFLQVAMLEQRIQNLVRLHRFPEPITGDSQEKLWLVSLLFLGPLPLAWLVFNLPHILHLP
jgi:bla regulator protein blaR1